MSDTSTAPVLCSEISLQAGEPLMASATHTEVWFALEIEQNFGVDAFPEAQLPAAVKDHLSAALRAVPHSRMQMLRRGKERSKAQGYAFFVALARDGGRVTPQIEMPAQGSRSPSQAQQKNAADYPCYAASPAPAAMVSMARF